MLEGFLADEGFEVLIEEFANSEDYVNVALYDEAGEVMGLANLRTFNYHKYGEYILAHATAGGPAKVVIEVAVEEPDSLDRLVKALRDWRPPESDD